MMQLVWGYCYDVISLLDTMKTSFMAVNSVGVFMRMWLCPYIGQCAMADALAMVVWPKVVAMMVAEIVAEVVVVVVVLVVLVVVEGVAVVSAVVVVVRVMMVAAAYIWTGNAGYLC